MMPHNRSAAEIPKQRTDVLGSLDDLNLAYGGQ